MRMRIVIAGVTAAATSLMLHAGVNAQGGGKTTWDGVYTEEQATRGQALYQTQCANCHAPDGTGLDAPPIAGPSFAGSWNDLTLDQLADRIRISMPLNAPETLDRKQTADIVAYLLKLNRFPAGSTELSERADGQSGIKYVATKPQASAAPAAPAAPTRAAAPASSPAPASAAATSPVACDVAALQAKAPSGTTIKTARIVAATGSQPKHCLVDGQVATPGNQVTFRLGLPEQWNGKYYFVGVGGTGGTIGRLDAGLTRGYASASTDTGHSRDEREWAANHAKRIDYGHRGTHVTAVAGKALAAGFYGRAPEHAYFNGCSNGGRQALMEVQRYPEDFDGIIAGDPATGTPMQAARALVFQKLLASPASYLPIEKIELLSAVTLATCDAADGLKDGLVSNPRACTFKPESLKCAGADGPTCLTAPQLAVVKAVYDGVKLSNGELYAYGFPPGHEGGSTGWRGWITGNSPPTAQKDGTLAFSDRLPSGFRLSQENFSGLALEKHDDPSFNWRTFNPDRDLPRMKMMTEILSPSDPDLRPYKARGGKLLIYHGLADPAISAYGSEDYYNKVTKVVGGRTEVESFARLYLVPGMHHCRGGEGPDEFDMLTALENWVEKGVAPASILAEQRSGEGTTGPADRSRPICPYPQMAKYKGTGSIDQAENFSCVNPQ